MSERSPKSKDSAESRPSRRGRRVAVAVGAVAFAAAAVGAALVAGGDEKPARPTHIVREAGGQAGVSPEMQVQAETRQDAVAITQAVGDLLARSGGVAGYDGRQFDNDNEEGAPQPGEPNLKIVRNDETHMMTVSVRSTDGSNVTELQMHVARSDTWSNQPVDAETIGQGPSDLTSIDVTSLNIQQDGGDVVPQMYEVRGGLVDAAGVPLTAEAADQVAGEVLGNLQAAADELGQPLLQSAADQLAS